MAHAPRPHQAELIDFFFRSQLIGALAWHGMGLGKTLSSLWIARMLLNRLREGGIASPKFLVVVPKSAISTWKTECAKHTPDLVREMLIIPYSQLHKAKARIPYVDIRFIIFDESHYLKSIDTDRIKSLINFLDALANSARGFQYGRILDLSGTPMPNTAAEFYTTWAKCGASNLREVVARLKDQKRFENWRALFSNMTEKAWTTGQGEKKKSHHAISYEGVANVDKLNQMLAPIVHYRRVEDCIQLPEKEVICVDIGLEDDKLLEDADITKPEYYMATVERLSRAKIPYMLEWVKDYLSSTQEQLVIFSMHTKPLFQLKDKHKSKIALITGDENDRERAKTIKLFQEGKIQVLGMSYQCGAEALNLQNARRTLYHGYPWNWAKLDQAMCRTHRSGQKQTTFHYVLTSGMNDENLFNKVMSKKEATNKVESSLLGEEVPRIDDIFNKRTIYEGARPEVITLDKLI